MRRFTQNKELEEGTEAEAEAEADKERSREH
jgi:hypothetical protein